MRIVLVTDSFFPAVDATTTTVKQVVDRLIDRGHTVQVVAPGPGQSSYRRSPVARIRPLDKPGRQVRAALEAFGPDLVQVHSPGTLGRKALKHGRALGARTITVQQAPVGDLTAEYWLRTIAARSDRMLTTSRWNRDRIADLGVAAAVWEPGVDPVAFAPTLRDEWLHGTWSRRKSPDGPLVVVGYVGSLRKRNGVRRLADLSGRPGLRPVVVGEGAQRAWLESRMPDARFHGALGPGDLATAVASLDVLVHPGTEETDCHALREAAASGVPVVAPASGGAAEWVRHRETGLLYDPDEDAGLLRAVDTLVADVELRRRLGAAARDVAAERTWVTAADELIDRHHHALRTPAPGRPVPTDLRIA